MQIYKDTLIIKVVKGSEADTYFREDKNKIADVKQAIRKHLESVEPEDLSKDCPLTPFEYLYSFPIEVDGKTIDVEIGWGETKKGYMFAPACTVKMGAA